MDRYFDHAATTPVDPHVLNAMMPFLQAAYGNAHSLHAPGRWAMHAVDVAREQVARLIGSEDPGQIVFTSGATEANNHVLAAHATGGVSISPFEHSSVLEPALHHGCQILANLGWKLQLEGEPGLLAVMTVNNETGAVLSAPYTKSSSKLLRDVTQHVGKLPLALTGIDYATFSAHKIYGPKGVGALYTASGMIEPLLRGGGQEHGLRAGTMNVPGIVGFGEAAKIAFDRRAEDYDHARLLRGILLESLANLEDWRLNEHVEQSPFILSLSFHGVEAQPVLQEVDARGFQASSGAACSSAHTDPSHVLASLGIEPDWLSGTIRISFGRTNTAESARDFATALAESIRSVRKLRR